MEYGRHIIYFSGYEEGVKVRNAGYMAVLLKDKQCEVQMYYRASEEENGSRIQPVYMFLDGTVTLGTEIFVDEGMATVSFQTVRQDFLQSGHAFEELETVRSFFSSRILLLFFPVKTLTGSEAEKNRTKSQKRSAVPE